MASTLAAVNIDRAGRGGRRGGAIDERPEFNMKLQLSAPPNAVLARRRRARLATRPGAGSSVASSRQHSQPATRLPARLAPTLPASPSTTPHYGGVLTRTHRKQAQAAALTGEASKHASTVDSSRSRLTETRRLIPAFGTLLKKYTDRHSGVLYTAIIMPRQAPLGTVTVLTRLD